MAAKTTTTTDADARRQKLTPCLCGCGAQVPRMFKQGHDAKLKGRILRAEQRAHEDQADTPDWAKFNIPAAAIQNLDHLFKGRFAEHYDPNAK